jgi:hypothetical protein
VIDETGLHARLVAKQAKDLLKRGYHVQARARQLLGGGTPGHPRRVDTGDLRSSVQVQLTTYRGQPAVRVGSNRQKARWVHEGTGIYGPRRALIKPKRARALAFTTRSGKKIVVRSVRGMRPNHFLTDALPAARN